MKVLTAAEMREVDRRTIEAGIPGIVLMENAGHRVVEFLAEKFAPLSEQRIVVLCGKGNNGGDGLVVARQLHTRFRPRALHVVLLAEPAQLKGDAAANYRMLQVCGCPVEREIAPAMRSATLVLDALLGTGLTGPAPGAMLRGHSRNQHRVPARQSGRRGHSFRHAERFGRAARRSRARGLHRHVHRTEDWPDLSAQLRTGRRVARRAYRRLSRTQARSSR